MAKCVQAVFEFNSLLRCQMHQFLEILAAMADCWDRICGVRARIEIRFVLLVEVQVGCVSQLNYSKKKIAANKARRCRRRAVQLVVTSSDSRDLTAAMELNGSCVYVWQVCKVNRSVIDGGKWSSSEEIEQHQQTNWWFCNGVWLSEKMLTRSNEWQWEAMIAGSCIWRSGRSLGRCFGWDEEELAVLVVLYVFEWGSLSWWCWWRMDRRLRMVRWSG